MNILAIETSCDETGLCLLEATGQYPNTTVKVRAHELASQVSEHQEYGGVFPSLAKRLHAQNTPALLEKLFADQDTKPVNISTEKKVQVREWLSRHPKLAEHLIKRTETSGLPNLNAVTVTVGPGLEPALWAGLNIARAIALFLDVPVVSVNHMEGHLLSALAPDSIADGGTHTLKEVDFPAVALLVSGGHTELVKISGWQQYEKIGQTRDDAAGEAFDKVGRVLGLPYPAGPAVSRLAETYRKTPHKDRLSVDSFPRPMINTAGLDFSFSGLKTAAARAIKRAGDLSDRKKQAFACELETAIVDVLVQKSNQALEKIGSKTLLVGGGVSANAHLRERLRTETAESVYLSPRVLAGDNALMIGLAGTGRLDTGVDAVDPALAADSRLSL